MVSRFAATHRGSSSWRVSRSRLATVTLLAGTFAALSTGCAGMRIGGASPEALREQTLVVHVKSSKRVASLFHSIANGYRTAGENEKADFFDAHVGDGFGSGFVVRSPAAAVGQTGSALLYAVTNRHVVDLADDPEIEVGSMRLPAEVIYTDPVYDLAVLAPKAGWPRRMEPMAIATMPPHDLDEVIATGYPALGGNPSYQSTQGNVSNASVALGGVTFIQHSAPIDPGSSGGPLMNNAGFVVGVNTGKAPGRDNVYLAVPSKAVKGALIHAAEAMALRKTEGWEGASLRAACRALATGLTAEELTPSTVFSIGDDLVAERGFESLRVVDADQHTTTKDRQVLRAAFTREPVALLRVSVALRLFIEAHEVDGPAVACTTKEEPNAERIAKLSIQFQNRTRETVWRFEQGQWRLSAISGLRAAGPAAQVAASGHERATKDVSAKGRKTKDASGAEGTERGPRAPREVPRR